MYAKNNKANINDETMKPFMKEARDASRKLMRFMGYAIEAERTEAVQWFWNNITDKMLKKEIFLTFSENEGFLVGCVGDEFKPTPVEKFSDQFIKKIKQVQDEEAVVEAMRWFNNLEEKVRYDVFRMARDKITEYAKTLTGKYATVGTSIFQQLAHYSETVPLEVLKQHLQLKNIKIDVAEDDPNLRWKLLSDNNDLNELIVYNNIFLRAKTGVDEEKGQENDHSPIAYFSEAIDRSYKAGTAQIDKLNEINADKEKGKTNPFSEISAPFVGKLYDQSVMLRDNDTDLYKANPELSNEKADAVQRLFYCLSEMKNPTAEEFSAMIDRWKKSNSPDLTFAPPKLTYWQLVCKHRRTGAKGFIGRLFKPKTGTQIMIEEFIEKNLKSIAQPQPQPQPQPKLPSRK